MQFLEELHKSFNAPLFYKIDLKHNIPGNFFLLCLKIIWGGLLELAEFLL